MTIKLIGAGFGRTGTTSIKAALEELGFDPCYHMIEVLTDPSQVAIWQAAISGKPVDWSTLFADYQATVDWPGCTFYQELLATYPEAKVLLTVRDPEKWYDSTAKTIYSLPRSSTMRIVKLFVPHFRRFYAMNEQLIWQGTFGGRFEDRQHAIAIFQAHIEAVKQTVPADKLLVYDVREGWEPLCKFLGVPVPEGKPFPRLNDGVIMQRVMKYGLVVLLGAVAALIGLGWWLVRRLTKRLIERKQ